MKQPLNRALKTHFEQQQLKPERIEALLDQQRPQSRSRRAFARRSTAWIGTAALVLVAVILLHGLPWDAQDADLYDEVAAEVVRNHLHLKPLEIATNDITQIQNYFDRLDFMPQSSTYLADAGLDLLGGRYCSLQGVSAAQLRLQSAPAAPVHTLYEVGYDPGVFRKFPNYDRGQKPVVVWSMGVKVTLWTEKGILFALAEEPETGAESLER